MFGLFIGLVISLLISLVISLVKNLFMFVSFETLISFIINLNIMVTLEFARALLEVLESVHETFTVKGTSKLYMIS